MRRILSAAVMAGSLILATGCASEPPPASEKVQQYYDENVKAGATLPPKESAAPVTLTRSTPDEPLRVLFVGDSLTDGFFATEEAKSFKEIMIDKLGPVELTNAALAHQTLSTVSKVTDVPADLDLTVVQLGTNDVGIPTPLGEFTTQYDALLAKIKEKSPATGLLCAGTWTQAGSAYDNVIAESCEKAGGRYVSFAGMYQNGAFHGPEKLNTWKGTSDWFHPNDAGHSAIATELLSVVAVK